MRGIEGRNEWRMFCFHIFSSAGESGVQTASNWEGRTHVKRSVNLATELGEWCYVTHLEYSYNGPYQGVKVLSVIHSVTHVKRSVNLDTEMMLCYSPGIQLQWTIARSQSSFCRTPCDPCHTCKIDSQINAYLTHCKKQTEKDSWV